MGQGDPGRQHQTGLTRQSRSNIPYHPFRENRGCAGAGRKRRPLDYPTRAAGDRGVGRAVLPTLLAQDFSGKRSQDRRRL
jgi:hypothetical protein